jgi:hypothetical protein
MNDEHPIIIVDNISLLPISRVSHSGMGSGERIINEKPPFGIVDRVTISQAARHAYRQFQHTAAGPPHPARLPVEEPKAITYKNPAKQILKKV